MCAAPAFNEFLDQRLSIAPIGIDDFSPLRHMHATLLRTQTADVLSETEVATFIRLVYSPEYTDMLMQEEVYGGWIDDELVGTASWQANGDDGAVARIGWIFVRHPRFGIGRRLLTEVEARAQHCGFDQLAVSATANAVPFFERMGYRIASRGVRSVVPGCALHVAFLRKHLLRPVHARLT